MDKAEKKDKKKNRQAFKIDQEYVLWRLSDWKKRLNQLCIEISDWTENLGKAEINKKDIPQAREELMHRFGIEPETVPALVIRCENHRTSFIPMGLWVIGSNGRVNITTDRNRYTLLDLGGDDGEPSQWTIVNSSKRKQRKSLDQNTFAQLIRDEALFQ